MAEEKVHRSGPTLMAAQLSGLCQGLQSAATTPQGVSRPAISLLRKFLKDCREMYSGPCIAGWPEIPDEATLGDLLVVAETLKATAWAFLQPDEFDEMKALAPFGLAPRAKAT